MSLKVLRNFEVPKAPKNLQRKAIARLDAISAKARSLAALYQQKIDALDALKKSLLHDAFTDQL